MAIYYDFYTIDFTQIDIKKEENKIYEQIIKLEKPARLKKSSSSLNHAASYFYDKVLDSNLQSLKEQEIHNAFFCNLFWNGWKERNVEVECHYYKVNEIYCVLKRDKITEIIELEKKVDYSKLAKISLSLSLDQWDINFEKFYDQVQDWMEVYQLAESKAEDLILSIG